MKHLNSGKLRHGISAVALTAAVIAAVILLNVGFGVLADRGLWMIDLTSEKMYTLTDETVDMLTGTFDQVNGQRRANGEEDVEVDIIFCADPDLIKGNEKMRYIYYTARALEKKFPGSVKVSTTNVWTNPSSVDRYRTNSYSSIYQSNIIVASGSEFRITTIETYYTYNSDSSGDEEPWAYNAEKKFTQSIIAVTKAEAPICGITVNHGEALSNEAGRAEYSELLSVIRNAGYEIQFLDLSKDDIPENCRLILTFDPQTDFISKKNSPSGVAETSKLDRFLGNAYSFMIFVDADTPELPNLEEYLREWGISFDRQRDADENWIGNWQVKSGTAIDADGLKVIADYEQEALGGSITKNMREKGGSPKVIFGNAMPINYSPSYEVTYQMADKEKGTGAFTYGSYYRNARSRAIYDMFRANIASAYLMKDGVQVPQSVLDAVNAGLDGKHQIQSPNNNGYYRLMTMTRESRTVGEGKGYTNVNDASYVCAVGSTEFASNRMLGSGAYGNTDVLLETLRSIGREVVPVGLNFKPMYDSEMKQSSSSSSGSTDSVVYYTEKGNIARTAVLTVLPAVVMAALGITVLVRRKFRH